MMPSKIQIIGTRKCEQCGSDVNIIKTSLLGEEKEVSQCLKCDTQRVEQQCSDFHKQSIIRKAEVLFERYSMLSDDLLSAKFESYIPDHISKEEAKKKMEWYARHYGTEKMDFKSLLLQGSYGLGKSHLAFSVGQALKEKGTSVIFLYVPDLLTALKDTFKKNASVTEIEFLRIIKSVDLLILDDIGAEYVRQDDGKESWAVEKLFQVFSARLGKTNIYTTNYTAEGLKNKYGEHGARIISRMMQGTKTIKIEGNDYRLKGGR
jgi:DNA replication protein DnaC